MPTPAKTNRTGQLLNRLGPFFGLVLVIALFAGLLSVKDVADQKEKESSNRAGSWTKAARSCSFDGLKAFTGVTNLKTVLSQTVIVAIGALGMT